MPPFGGHVHIEYHNHSYPRPPPSPLRGPLPLKGTQERYGIYLSISYDMISITSISHLRWLPPLVLYGTTFPPRWEACHTILRSFCSLTNRVPLPPHPGHRINRSMLSYRDMAPLLSIHSAPSKRGKGGGASHQRGNAFPRPQGGCKGFIIRGRLL